MPLTQLKKDLQRLRNPQKAKIYARFFKTGKGEYGEGDQFLGITVPQQRKIVKKYLQLTLKDLEQLFQSKIHEHRSVCLSILVNQFKKANSQEQKQIIEFYLKNTKFINNWDLVDISAPKIIGQYLYDHPEQKPILVKLAKSKNLWEKRISILATYTFIKAKDFSDALKISKILLHDKHDLIHKAVGWMLREIGKKDQGVEEEFLKKYYQVMPRTMLRYAIEKFSEEKRRFYLNKRP